MSAHACTHTHTHTLLFYYYYYSGYDYYHCNPTLPSELLISQSSKLLYLEGLHFQIRKLVLREVKKLEQDHTAHKKLKAIFLHQHYVHSDIPEFFLICLHILSSDHASFYHLSSASAGVQEHVFLFGCAYVQIYAGFCVHSGVCTYTCVGGCVSMCVCASV